MKKEEIGIILLYIVMLIGVYFVWSLDSENKELKKKLQQEEVLNEWVMLQEAIILTESNFEEGAVGGGSALGIFQITPIYVEECNRILGKEVYKHEDALNVEKSLEMFNIIQDYYNPEKDLNLALKHHNDAGWYKKKVKKNLEYIKKLEEIRRKILDKN